MRLESLRDSGPALPRVRRARSTTRAETCPACGRLCRGMTARRGSRRTTPTSRGSPAPARRRLAPPATNRGPPKTGSRTPGPANRLTVQQLAGYEHRRDRPRPLRARHAPRRAATASSAASGKGGMGEVYRADDLKLGQPVALKFLPEVGRPRSRAARRSSTPKCGWRGRCRIPNVCRVYDVGEFDGHTFLSMEYVDGEDLASLLRRIGRFPQDRALELARQICAGLAAAHDRGVLHRDLKPANIMLDGGGRVRITDFGLAGRGGRSAARRHARLHGARAARRRRGHAAQRHLRARPRALRALHRAPRARRRQPGGAHRQARAGRHHARRPTSSATSTRRSSASIMRCLEPDPARRPGIGARASSAALPGGDPLAAALAAGETPSPEMVAASGSTEAVAAARRSRPSRRSSSWRRSPCCSSISAC